MSKRLLRISLAVSIIGWIIIILTSMILPGPARVAGAMVCPQGWHMERETFESSRGTSVHFTCFSPAGEELDRSAAMLGLQAASGLPVVVFGSMLVIQAERDARADLDATRSARKRRDHAPGKLTAPLKELEKAYKAGQISKEEYEERRKAILDKTS
jgi:hypothetical protein